MSLSEEPAHRSHAVIKTQLVSCLFCLFFPDVQTNQRPKRRFALSVQHFPFDYTTANKHFSHIFYVVMCCHIISVTHTEDSPHIQSIVHIVMMPIVPFYMNTLFL